MSFLLGCLLVVISFVAGYILYPFTIGFFNKEKTLIENKLIDIKSIISSEITKDEEKIKRILAILQGK